MVRETSLISYQEILSEGLINERQAKVYDVILRYPCLTDMEIMRECGFNDPNKVRPRRKELFDYGLIKNEGKKRCSITKRLAYSWSVIHFVPKDFSVKKHRKDHFSNGYATRPVVSRSLEEFNAKIVMYFLEFNPKHYETIIVYSVYKKGVYKALLRRLEDKKNGRKK